MTIEQATAIMKPTKTMPRAAPRPVAAVGKVGHQEGERIGERAPGQDVGEREAPDLP